MTQPFAGDNIVGGLTPPPLLNDDDYSDFAGLDLDWYLNAAGSTVRSFLGWHCAPSLTVTRYVDMTGDGTILLPTRHLTAVTSVAPAWSGAPALDAGCYWWDDRGWINIKGLYGAGLNPGLADLWPIDTARLFDAYPKRDRRMVVEFTHGWPNLPYPVAEVSYELVMRMLEKPAGVAEAVQAGPYKFNFREFGCVLSDDQKDRLASYKLPGVR